MFAVFPEFAATSNITFRRVRVSEHSRQIGYYCTESHHSDVGLLRLKASEDHLRLVSLEKEHSHTDLHFGII